ncbi:MAG: hypothetical protein H7X80_01630, partial [bacterium]|nr:hypothetical protein [Candidatus Kapabacteria bacterium]
MLLALPGRMARKEGTMLWHPEHRLRRTMLTVIVDGVRYSPQHDSTIVEWGEPEDVVIRWTTGAASVEERLHIATSMGNLTRDVIVKCEPGTVVEVEAALYANPVLFDEFRAADGLSASGYHQLRLHTAGDSRLFERFCTVDSGGSNGEPIRFHYTVRGVGFLASDERARSRYLDKSGSVYVRSSFEHVASSGSIQRQFQHSRRSMRAAVSFDGRFNASLFQYEFEWGMDAAMVASAACAAGDHELAAEVIDNIVSRLSNDDGMIAEAGRFRGGELSELNGNGAVLNAINRYHRCTRDVAFIREHWHRIVAIAEYPLREEFKHECGMLRTRRDFWERFPWQGVGDGFELGHQVYCSVGLAAAAELADVVGDAAHAQRWRSASQRIRTSTLEHPTHRLIENGTFIRRRRVDGTHENALAPDTEWRLAEYDPYLPQRATASDAREPSLNCEPDIT